MIKSVEILLTTDCTIDIGDEIEFCLTINTDSCQHETIGILEESSFPNMDALDDTSVNLLTPFYVSSQCMVYTMYSDIKSDIGVTNNIQSSHWHNTLSNNAQKCENNWCTFSVKILSTKHHKYYRHKRQNKPETNINRQYLREIYWIP